MARVSLVNRANSDMVTVTPYEPSSNPPIRTTATTSDSPRQDGLDYLAPSTILKADEEIVELVIVSFRIARDVDCRAKGAHVRCAEQSARNRAIDRVFIPGSGLGLNGGVTYDLLICRRAGQLGNCFGAVLDRRWACSDLIAESRIVRCIHRRRSGRGCRE